MQTLLQLARSGTERMKSRVFEIYEEDMAEWTRKLSAAEPSNLQAAVFQEMSARYEEHSLACRAAYDRAVKGDATAAMIALSGISIEHEVVKS